MSWLENHTEGVIIKVYVQPRASKDEVVGLHGEPQRLKIRVKSPPVDGEANAACIQLFSTLLCIPKHSVVLLKGEKGKQKNLLCRTINIESARRILMSLV